MRHATHCAAGHPHALGLHQKQMAKLFETLPLLTSHDVIYRTLQGQLHLRAIMIVSVTLQQYGCTRGIAANADPVNLVLLLATMT